MSTNFGDDTGPDDPLAARLRDALTSEAAMVTPSDDGLQQIRSGIDQQTKKFTEPPDQIKSEIASIKANKSIPEPQKKEDLVQLEAALKDTKPIQFKENIALVLKYFDQLAPLMQDQDSKRPAD